MARLILLAALCLLVSCGAPITPGVGGTPPRTTTPISSADPAATPGLATPLPTIPATATPTAAFATPPLVALSYGGITRTASPVSSTWITAQGMVIGDGFPHPGQTEPLPAPVGADFILTAISAPPPSYVRIMPYEVMNGQARVEEPYLPEFRAQIASQRSVIRADLTPGDYLFYVLVHWEGGNIAGYGFRVILSL